MSAPIKVGDLVTTDDGYIGIVTYVGHPPDLSPAEPIGGLVALGNGTEAVYSAEAFAQLVHRSLLASGKPANFLELVECRLPSQEQRLRGRK